MSPVWGKVRNQGHQQAEVYNVLTRYTPRNQPLSSNSGIYLSLLPPCRSSLQMHITSTHLEPSRVADPELQKSYQGHGWAVQGTRLEYKWTQEEMLPKSLTDLVLDQDEGDQDSTRIMRTMMIRMQRSTTFRKM